MAEQIYHKVFYASRNTFYEDKRDAREKALRDANEFFFKYDSLYIVSILEEWDDSTSHLQLVVYYKNYI